MPANAHIAGKWPIAMVGQGHPGADEYLPAALAPLAAEEVVFRLIAVVMHPYLEVVINGVARVGSAATLLESGSVENCSMIGSMAPGMDA